MKQSLRTPLLGLWILIVIICISLAVLMANLFQLGTNAELQHVRSEILSAQQDIYARFDASSSTNTGLKYLEDVQGKQDLNVMVQTALASHKGVEGGIWTPDGSFIAYAYPTYGGGIPKKDVPEAEKSRIVSLASDALRKQRQQEQHFDYGYESLIIIAEPLGDASKQGVIWTMSRAHVGAGAAYQKLSIAFAILFCFALISGLWLAFVLQRWMNHVARLESAISSAPAETLPVLAETGQKELDRIVSAINQLAAKLKQAQSETQRLNKHLVKTERMTVLGHMAAEVAHDIRNPIAAMRLRVENALAKSEDHYKPALEFTLQEIRRLDELLERLVAVTHLSELKRTNVALRPWLEQRMGALQERARDRNIILKGVAADGEWCFDENGMTRVLDNLLLNSLQHTPEGGWISVTIQTQEKLCRIIVEDSGTGIALHQTEQVFDSMMTTRREGLGLGLAIAREIVKAHDGTLQAVNGAHGARFEMELPWRVS